VTWKRINALVRLKIIKSVQTNKVYHDRITKGVHTRLEVKVLYFLSTNINMYSVVVLLSVRSRVNCLKRV